MKIKKEKTLAFFVFLIIASLLFQSFGSPTILEAKWSYDSKSISKIADLQGKKYGIKKRLNYVPGQVIVKFKKGIKESEKRTLLKKTSARALRTASFGSKEKNVYLLQTSNTKKLIDSLKKHPEVEYAEPNYLMSPAFIPNDTYFYEQWYLKNTGQIFRGVPGLIGADIGAEKAWDTERGLTSSVTVAVIDTGVDFDHPELEGKNWVNTKENPSNGIDDDRNGLIDDYNGYDFAGLSNFYCDSYYELGYGDFSGAYDSIAQSLVGAGQVIKEIGLYLARHGNPTYSINIYIKESLQATPLASAEIDPTKVQPSTILGQVDETNLVKVYLNRPVKLQKEKTYYIVLQTRVSYSGFYLVGIDKDYGEYEDENHIYPDTYDFLLGDFFVNDNGIWYEKPDADLSFTTNPGNAVYDEAGHGTQVASIISANTDNNYGISGITHGANIMSLKASGGGCFDVYSVAEAIKYAANSGAKIINMSFGGYDCSQFLQDAINYAYSKGVILIAAAGNEDKNDEFYPAACDNVIAVSSTDHRDEISIFSNFGDYIDLAAPGEFLLAAETDLLGRNPGPEFDYVSGTSFSSAVVSGVAALLVSFRGRDISPKQIEILLTNSAKDIDRDGKDIYTGYGRVDAFQALNLAQDRTPPKIYIQGISDNAIYRSPVRITFYTEDLNDKIYAYLDNMEFKSGHTVFEEGKHKLLIYAIDRSGNSLTKLVTFTIDMTSPLPGIGQLPSYSSSNSTKTFFNISYSATDNLSGISSFDLEYRPNYSSTFVRLLSSTTQTAYTFSGSQGLTYYFRVRAKDKAG
ncbi:MAG: S8 family serine peptidase, partial [Actinobacteria bacterium]|nr:S8 family serine peptidase [Actinomycetota bacterium]